MKQHIRMLTAALCVVVLLCGFSVTAYASGGDEPWEGLETVETPETGKGFSGEGSLVTRDLLYDEHTNKQFITVQTSGGSTFYLVIDYDKPVDEEGEQYETYFFSVVDEADLLAAFEAAGGEPPKCTCTEKCGPGAVHTDCPICAVNMSECAGTVPEPEPEPEVEPEPPKEKSKTGTLLLILAVIAVGGGAGWYLKIYRPKHQKAAEPEEDDYEPEYDDDTPPWDDDENEEEEV